GTLTDKAGSFQELSDEALIGRAAGAAVLLHARVLDRAWFKGKSADSLRNELIVQNGKHTGRTDLQALSNQQLVGLTFEWFDWIDRAGRGTASDGGVDALKQRFAVMPGVLLVGDWKVPGRKHTLSAGDRSALL